MDWQRCCNGLMGISSGKHRRRGKRVIPTSFLSFDCKLLEDKDNVSVITVRCCLHDTFYIAPKPLSVQISCSVMSDFLRPRGLQHARPPCPSPTPGVYSNSCPLSRWCHLTISSSVVPFFSCLQSFPASGSFQMSQPFASGGQRIGVSASISVFPMNTRDWSPSGWTGWISLQSKGLSRVFSNTTVQKHQFFSAQLSL